MSMIEEYRAMKIIISGHLRIRNYDIPVKLLLRQYEIEFFCFPTHALLSLLSQPYPIRF